MHMVVFGQITIDQLSSLYCVLIHKKGFLKKMIPRVRGTHDSVDLSLFNAAVTAVKKHLTLYHFTEIATPLLETVELFKRSLGTHTDVVSKEMFLVTGGNAKEDDEALCLRPEATAPTMRVFLEENIQQSPWRVFSVGPMFRYERPQKGRYRQFTQVSIECIAAQGMLHDVQLIAMLDRLFDDVFGLDTYALLINFLGCASDRKAYEQLLKDYLATVPAGDLCESCKMRQEKNLLRIFDCKNVGCQERYEKAPKVTDALCGECEQEYQLLQQYLHLLGISHMPEPRLVRGLDYYTKVVFEFVSENLGAQKTFCAGGRYDGLARQLQAPHDVPAIGAAIGIERLLLLLESRKDDFIKNRESLAVVLPLSKAQEPLALLLADLMRKAAIATEILTADQSLKSAMRTANKLQATWVLLLGDEEQKKQTVTVRTMSTAQQMEVLQRDIVAYLKKVI
jgi:histidyl-tRNA synthetase